MKRRVIKQGHNTLTITLPSDWTKRYNVLPGAEVDLTEKSNGLFVSTEKHNNFDKTEFDITGMDIPTIWKYFMAAYREGYDEVLIKFNESDKIDSPYKFLTQHRIDLAYKKEREKKRILEALHGLVTRFIGFEIVEHGKGFVIVREMGHVSEKEFDNSLRRIFFLIQQMSEETLEAIKTKNPKIISHMHDVDINLDKFHDYCIRILNKTANKDCKKTSLYFSILFLLELIGDEFKNISTHLINDFPNMKMKHVQVLVESIKEQIDSFYDLFYKFDKEKIKKVSEIDSRTYMVFPEIYKKSSEEEKEIFHHLRMISRYINSLLELRIEMEF